MKHLIVATMFFMPIVCLSNTYAASDSRTVSLQLTIHPYLQFKSEQLVHSYTIKSEDIHRGYIDLAETATITIRTNDPHPIAVTATGEGRETILLVEHGISVQPGTASAIISDHLPGQLITKTFGCRIILSSGTRTGTYPLQMILTPQTL
jgi:hypothetical protein